LTPVFYPGIVLVKHPAVDERQWTSTDECGQQNWFVMDKVTDSETARCFLRQLGIHVREDVVKQVLHVLSGKAKRSLYSLYTEGRDKQPPICGKGTVYKIKKLYLKDQLGPYVDYISVTLTTGETKREQTTEPMQHVIKEPGTEQEPYKETSHTKRMRELADKLAQSIYLPSLFNSDLRNNLPVHFQPGKYCLSIGAVEISEDKQIKVNYRDPSANLAASRHVKWLYSHLRTSKFPEFTELVGGDGKLNSWMTAVGKYSEALIQFLKIIADTVTDRVKVNFHEEVEPGLTKWFITTIWIDAVQQAGEHPWIDNLWYKPPDNIPNTSLWKQDCGLEHISIMKNKETLKAFEIWHKQLRHRYAMNPLASEIAIEGQEINDLAEEIRQRLQEFSDMQYLPGYCEFCHPRSELTKEQAQE